MVPATPGEQELATLVVAESSLRSKLARDTKAQFIKEYGGGTIDYDKLIAGIELAPRYRARVGKRWKVLTAAGPVFIAPAGIRPGPMGWDFDNVVFRWDGTQLAVLGHFDGCVQGFRDLDADGVPEVLAQTCENDEGHAYEFWSLVPVLKRVASH